MHIKCEYRRVVCPHMWCFSCFASASLVSIYSVIMCYMAVFCAAAPGHPTAFWAFLRHGHCSDDGRHPQRLLPRLPELLQLPVRWVCLCVCLAATMSARATPTSSSVSLFVCLFGCYHVCPSYSNFQFGEFVCVFVWLLPRLPELLQLPVRWVCLCVCLAATTSARATPTSSSVSLFVCLFGCYHVCPSYSNFQFG